MRIEGSILRDYDRIPEEVEVQKGHMSKLDAGDQVVMDLTDINDIGSKAIDAVVALYKHSVELQIPYTVEIGSKRMLNLFRVLNLHKLITFKLVLG